MDHTSQTQSQQHLPDIATVDMGAPLRWLGGGWKDFCAAPIPCLFYGLALFSLSSGLVYLLYLKVDISWILIMVGGFFLLAPMMTMGLYEAGRQIESGQRPSLGDILFVKGAMRRDLAYLGLALFLLYMMWTSAGHIIYGLSTSRLSRTPVEFLTFLFTDPAGQRMALFGTLVGGVFAFLCYMIVVVSAPMLLDQKTDVFIAGISSVRAILKNKLPMFIWALIIVVLMAISVGTALIGLIFIFPILGLASWRAYRDLVPGHPAPQTH